ncbi:MAG: SUMF1/EgtB/PvdO family nonheme iron enzyme [Bacteriovoracales bacterium]|nr:SUMF1/EgtB/PvdO family nonheme iron enzyme [Bacteriovoracales bacterium]
MTIKLHFIGFIRLLALAFFVNSWAFGGDGCSKFLRGEGETNGVTIDFMAYFKDLVDRQGIGNEELARFTRALERGELANPISEEKALENTRALMRRNHFQRYIDQGQLDLQELLKMSKRALKEREQTRIERAETKEKTLDIYRKIEFYPVSGGRFQMGERPYQTDVHLTNRIEAMSTPLTQKQWVEIMGENPSRFSDGLDSIKMDVNGKQISLRPDHPVESVSFWSAIVFANRLSKKHGFKPAYDLEGVSWRRGTKPEDGSLILRTGRIEINAPGKDYYRAEGYRLPTEAEQEYMLYGAGSLKGKDAFWKRESDLKKYAWLDSGQTQPVGELKGIVIGGEKFYDLYGNVWEWGWDWYGNDLARGKNPTGPTLGIYRIIRGGGWDEDPRFIDPARRTHSDPRHKSTDVGIRLVRTID